MQNKTKTSKRIGGHEKTLKTWTNITDLEKLFKCMKRQGNHTFCKMSQEATRNKQCLQHRVLLTFLASHRSLRKCSSCVHLFLFFPTMLAVLGVLSSCPRVMTMQCWKSQTPPPLSTRLRVCWFFGFVLTKKKRSTIQQNSPDK